MWEIVKKKNNMWERLGPSSDYIKRRTWKN